MAQTANSSSLGESRACRTLIHRAGRREHRPDEPGGAGFGRQEGMRERGLVDVRGGEPAVGGEQVVQVRRAAPPVAEDEHRRRHVHGHDLREVGPLLVAADGGVDEALGGDRLGPQPVGRVDGEPVLPQQAHPVPEGDTGEEARADRLEESLTPGHRCAPAPANEPTGGETSPRRPPSAANPVDHDGRLTFPARFRRASSGPTYPRQPSHRGGVPQDRPRICFGSGAPEVVHERLAVEPHLAGARAIVAFRVALAIARAAGVGHLDVGQVLLQVGEFLVHRHAVVFPAVADLDPADRARVVHPARAEHSPRSP